METCSFWVGDREIRVVDGRVSDETELGRELLMRQPMLGKLKIHPRSLIPFLLGYYWDQMDQIRCSDPEIDPLVFSFGVM
jgi:hypothetical protein